MTTTVESWAQRAARLPAVLVDTTPPAVEAGAHVLEDRARANLLRASGGDMRLSRVRSGRGGGQRVDVKVQVFGAGGNAEARVLPVGPVSLLEGPVRRHREPFAYGTGRRYAMAGERLAGGGTARRRRAARSSALFIPGVGFRGSVNHPGTPGTQPVERAFRASGDEAGRAGLQTFVDAVERHLRGA